MNGICLHVQGWLAFFDYQHFVNKTIKFALAQNSYNFYIFAEVLQQTISY